MTGENIAWLWGLGIVAGTIVAVAVCILADSVSANVRLVRIESHRARRTEAEAKIAEYAAAQAKSTAVVEVARARRGEVSE